MKGGPSTWAAAQSQRDRTQHTLQNPRAPDIPPCQPGRLLGERCPSALGVVAVQPPHLQSDQYLPTADREIAAGSSCGAATATSHSLGRPLSRRRYSHRGSPATWSRSPHRPAIRPGQETRPPSGQDQNTGDMIVRVPVRNPGRGNHANRARFIIHLLPTRGRSGCMSSVTRSCRRPSIDHHFSQLG